MAGVVSGCTYDDDDAFAVQILDDGTIGWLACSGSLPASASVWRIDNDVIIGDGDDELLWTSENGWADTDGTIAKQRSEVPWASDIAVSIEARSSFGTALERDAIPSSAEVLTLNGSIVMLDDFVADCSD